MYYILNSISLYFILGTGLSLCLLEIRWLHKQFAWQKASRFVKILWSNMAKQQRKRNNRYAKENCREILILVLSEVTCSCSTEHCPPERSAQVLHGATHKLITLHDPRLSSFVSLLHWWDYTASVQDLVPSNCAGLSAPCCFISTDALPSTFLLAQPSAAQSFWSSLCTQTTLQVRGCGTVLVRVLQLLHHRENYTTNYIILLIFTMQLYWVQTSRISKEYSSTKVQTGEFFKASWHHWYQEWHFWKA